MSLAEQLNAKGCLAKKVKGKWVLHFYLDEDADASTAKVCTDFPGHTLCLEEDPVNRKGCAKYVMRWEGQMAYCDDDCEWC